MNRITKRLNRSLLIYCLMSLFLTTALIPHAWMLSGKGSESSSNIRFKLRDLASEYEIETNKLDQSTVRVLGTTNLIDIKLKVSNNKFFRIFFGQWTTDDNNSMMVLRHTPDYCWVSTGWTFVDAGIPQIVYVNIPVKTNNTESIARATKEPTVRIPFECRIYRSPDKQYTEAVLWCSVLGGNLINSYGLVLESMGKSEVLLENIMNPPSPSKVRNNHLLYILKKRININSEKQYVRLSAEYDSNNTNNIQDLIKLVEKNIYIY